MSSMAGTSSIRMERFNKTKLCKFHAVGACTRGEDCNFAHGVVAIREQPDFSKTRLCPEFTRFGRCNNGEDCKFAHGKKDLRGKRDKAEQKQAQTVQSAQAVQMPFVYMLPMMQQQTVWMMPGPEWPEMQEGRKASEISLPEMSSRQSTTTSTDSLEEFDPDNDFRMDFSEGVYSGSTLPEMKTEGSGSSQDIPGNQKMGQDGIFCRNTSEETHFSDSSLPEIDTDGLLVKNTFIHYDTDEEQEAVIFRSKSMPILEHDF